MIRSFAYFITLLRKDFAEYCGRKLEEIGLSQGLLFFILYIGKHPGCSPRELAVALKMYSGHVARSLTRLEQAGFIFQNLNPRDRRAHILELTAKGREAFDLSHALFFQWDREILSGLEPEDRQILFSLLERLTEDRRGTCEEGEPEHGL